MKGRITSLEQQLSDQKAAYGELYSQMNRTITDIQNTAGEQDACDF